MEKIHLLLVEDHTVVRAGLRALFDQQSDMQVIAEAATAVDGLKLARASCPDVTVLDLTLAGGGSMDLIGRLRELAPPPRVLILTMHDDPAYARSALAAGATGYVVKSIGEQDLLAAVRAVARGQMFVDLDDDVRTRAVFGAILDKKTAHSVPKLSDREMEVLRRLGQGHTNQAIAEQLEISPKTVATYRARIAEKLGLKSTADFVRYATDAGLIPSGHVS